MLVNHWIFYALASLALPALAAQAPAPASLAQTLHASRGQHRLLLIGAPTAGQTDFQQQKSLLTTATSGLAERDMRVVEVPYDHLSAADRQYWQRQLGQSLSGFVVLLIGKDGGIKRTSPRPLAPACLFGTVDKMPMRRDEMRGKGE